MALSRLFLQPLQQRVVSLICELSLVWLKYLGPVFELDY